MGYHIYLNNKQSALIVDVSGVHSLHIPNQNDEDIVPGHITALTTISILLKTQDVKFQKYIERRWNELIANK